MAGKGNKSLTKFTKVQDEEKNRMVNLEEMKKVFSEMFKSHEKSVLDILAANNKIQNDRLDILTKHIEDIKESLQFTENELNTKILKVEQNLENETTMIKEKLRDLEDRTRRNNLRIDGVNESVKETWDETEEKVMKILKNNLGITTAVKIERAHRAGKIRLNSKRPRTIVIKILDYKDKTNILRNTHKLKGTGIFINEDFSRETIEKRKKLWVDVLQLREQGKYAVLQYDRIIQHEFRK